MAKNNKHKNKKGQISQPQSENVALHKESHIEEPVAISEAESSSSTISSNSRRIILGAVVVLVLLGVSFYKTASDTNQNQLKNTATYVSPIPEDESIAPTDTPEVIISPVVAEENKNKEVANPSAIIVTEDKVPTPVVKKLPYTKSKEFIYTVRTNDSLASIGETFCNDKKAYLYLSEDNNITAPYTLQVGQSLQVICK